MTNNQINWMRMQEERRANRANEKLKRDTHGEEVRHNTSVEGETMRHNIAQEQENVRHNYASEQANLFKFGEERRHNIATEGINAGNLELGYQNLSRNWAETEVGRLLAEARRDEVTSKSSLNQAQEYRYKVQNYAEFLDYLPKGVKEVAATSGITGVVLKGYVDAFTKSEATSPSTLINAQGHSTHSGKIPTGKSTRGIGRNAN